MFTWLPYNIIAFQFHRVLPLGSFTKSSQASTPPVVVSVHRCQCSLYMANTGEKCSHHPAELNGSYPVPVPFGLRTKSGFERCENIVDTSQLSATMNLAVDTSDVSFTYGVAKRSWRKSCCFL